MIFHTVGTSARSQSQTLTSLIYCVTICSWMKPAVSLALHFKQLHFVLKSAMPLTHIVPPINKATNWGVDQSWSDWKACMGRKRYSRCTARTTWRFKRFVLPCRFSVIFFCCPRVWAFISAGGISQIVFIHRLKGVWKLEEELMPFCSKDFVQTAAAVFRTPVSLRSLGEAS